LRVRLSTGQESKTSRGARAEQLAAEHLTHAGYRIVARNVRGLGGEIDIVAFDGPVLCFVEVRARSTNDFGTPLETISRQKIRRIVTAARQFLETLPPPWPEMRFDAVGILLGEQPMIELVRGAFEA
jgi:putative endonuclease